MTGYVYLATPYTHDDPAVREERFRLACEKAADLMARGMVVFCPIAHSHPIDQHFGSPGPGQFWKKQDAPFLAGASEMIVVKMDGWKESSGVQHEIRYALEHNIPVKWIDP